MNHDYDINEVLSYINPADLDYSEWVAVGMAIKDEGYSCNTWDEWSQPDPRYKAGDCFKKWDTFKGAYGSPVTIGTVIDMAAKNGYRRQNGEGFELAWDSVIGGRDNLTIIDKGWIESQEVTEPETWEPEKDLVTYLETLFDASENVGYVTETWEKDGKFLPKKGNYDRTAGELIEALNKCNGDIGAVFGDYKREAGAWIRFNPLDGKGVKNENVTEYRFALVESDDMEIDKQNALVRELELPVACLVHSGKKSLHAIVKIDATNYDDYRKRVDFMYSVLKKNGMTVDTQNKNPSRLSRMPGVLRGDKKQFLIDTNIGKASYAEWRDWIESINDDLPDPETISEIWDDLPSLANPLIDGVLRQGHKMLLAGPSKAGKSYALIELCCAIAEGRKWLRWYCTKGRVMYVNLELDRASCLHRFKDVYTALGWLPDNLSNIDVWNLRGKSVPMDKLAPKLIRRAQKKNYIAIIIDPIYKVITGDENSADQMAHFCNQFDRVCTELNCAVIYCHHHSKGAQGGKRSMDRASGSGVFARDPDALLDLIELDVTDALKKQSENEVICDACNDFILKNSPENINDVSQDDMCSSVRMKAFCEKLFSSAKYTKLETLIDEKLKACASKTAWRVEGTLREFPKFEPVNLWFDYPIHREDKNGALEDIQPDADIPWKHNFNKKKSPEERKNERQNGIETAFDVCNIDGNVTIQNLCEYTGVSEKTVRRRLKEHGGFWIDESKVGKK